MPPLIACSTKSDGTMLDRSRDNRHDEEIVAHRRAFCAKYDVDYDQCVYQTISYEPDTPFDTIVEVDAPNTEGIFADVLYTEKTRIGLFLPIADCVGVVLHDTARNALALAHIGRHASVAKTMKKTIEYFIKKGSVPKNMTIWMAPSVAKDDYVMQYFDHIDDADWQGFFETKDDGIHLDLQGFNAWLAVAAGIPIENIDISPINTALDPNYFSHSQGDTNGRFAVLAMMK